MRRSHHVPHRPDVDPKNLDLIRIDSPEQVEVGDTVYERVQFGPGPGHFKLNTYRVETVQRRACVVSRVRAAQGRGAARSAGALGATTTRTFNELLIERKVPKAPARLNTPFRHLQPPPRKLVAVPNTEPVAASSAVSNDSYSAWIAMGEELLTQLAQDREALARQRLDVANDAEAVDRRHAAHIANLEASLVAAQAERSRDAETWQKRLDSFDHRLAALELRSGVVTQIRQSGAA